MACAWSARTAALRATLEAQGLDLVAPLNLRWYNEVAPANARIAPTADGAGEDALAVLVGNSRALWPAFTAAHDSDPAIGDAEHPVDTFVARAIRDAIARVSLSGGETARDVETDPRVFDSHDTSPGKLVAIQRAAHVAGVAHLDEKCHLAIHEKYGPWIALRALLVFDGVRGPDEAHRPPPPPNPLATSEAARARGRGVRGGARGVRRSERERGAVAEVGRRARRRLLGLGDGRAPGAVLRGPGAVPLQLPDGRRRARAHPGRDAGVQTKARDAAGRAMSATSAFRCLARSRATLVEAGECLLVTTWRGRGGTRRVHVCRM